MGDRGVAPVVDLAQHRARRGANVGRGQARRANPNLRAPRMEMVVDYEAFAKLDRSSIRAVEKGARRPPLKAGKVRRGTAHRPQFTRNLKGPWSRQVRRLAWKIERRVTGEKVAWKDSRAAACQLAPVIPLHRRGTLARFRASLPRVGRSSGVDLMDGAA